jgi:hypothetical protein
MDFDPDNCWVDNYCSWELHRCFGQNSCFFKPNHPPPSPFINNGSIANSNSIKVGGNNYGEVAGGNIFNNQTVITQPLFATNTESKPAEKTNPTIEQVAAYYSQLAAARQWQPPELTNLATPYPNGQCVKIIFGVGTFVLPITITSEENAFSPISFFGQPVFTPYTKSNRLYVKALTIFGDAQQMVQLNNEWPAKIPPGWDRNFSSNQFEIVDENMLPVFQIRYDSPDTVEIRGIFVAPNGAETVVFDGIETAPAGQPIKKFPPRKAWFKYPSNNHLGELADQ